MNNKLQEVRNSTSCKQHIRNEKEKVQKAEVKMLVRENLRRMAIECARFGSTNTKIRTIQRRLATPSQE